MSVFCMIAVGGGGGMESTWAVTVQNLDTLNSCTKLGFVAKVNSPNHNCRTVISFYPVSEASDLSSLWSSLYLHANLLSECCHLRTLSCLYQLHLPNPLSPFSSKSKWW